MHTIQVYLHESLPSEDLSEIKKILLSMPFVKNVVINDNDHHDLMVDYDEHHGMPMKILDKLNSKGVHPDIISG